MTSILSRKAPKAIVLDVLGTAIPLDAVRKGMSKLGLSEEKAEVWYFLCQRDGIATAVTEDFASFKDVGAYHIQTLMYEAGIPIDSNSASEFFGTFADGHPYPDVGPAVTSLAERGIATCSLTNGAAAVTLAMYDKAGVSHLVDRELQLQIAEAGAWKPHAKAYDYLAEVLKEKKGWMRDELMMVSMHPWDINGAKKAGLQAAFIARHGEPFPSFFRQPDVVAKSIAALAEVLPK